MEAELEEGSTLVHSPRSHYHSQLSSKGLNSTSSNTDNDESDVSDMVIDNSSKFKSLSDERRRRSGGSDYHPHSESNSVSESDSESPTNSSDESRSRQSTPLATKYRSNNHQLSEDNSEESSRSRSVSNPPQRSYSRVNETPLVRKSPLDVSHRSSPSEMTSMRGYRYSMLPSRSAAMNVSYSRFLEGESDSENDIVPARKTMGRAKQLKESESEFEMSEASVEESVSSIGESEDFSEDGYRPRKKKGGRKKRKVSLV